MKNKTTAMLLTFFLGQFGAHYFYLGNKEKGTKRLLVSLLAPGIGAFIMEIMALIDFFKLLQMSDEEFDDIYNSGDGSQDSSGSGSNRRGKSDAEIYQSIKMYKDLYDTGVISAEEFEKKKAMLLSGSSSSRSSQGGSEYQRLKAEKELQQAKELASKEQAELERVKLQREQADNIVQVKKTLATATDKLEKLKEEIKKLEKDIANQKALIGKKTMSMATGYIVMWCLTVVSFAVMLPLMINLVMPTGPIMIAVFVVAFVILFILGFVLYGVSKKNVAKGLLTLITFGLVGFVDAIKLKSNYAKNGKELEKQLLENCEKLDVYKKEYSQNESTVKECKIILGTDNNNK